ncbi:MAG: hypothetical protein M3Z22_02465, partial [Verrucomicrobiota bacterium]|nr:hypothetical protein [Verrucomicrobiota bacterium]
GLWVVGGIASVPQFYEQVVLREFAGRFGETVHRPQPLYFYLPHLFHKFAPWSVLMIALALVWNRGRATLGRISPEELWLLCWAGGGLIVMSLVPSKRVDRIFPVLPPLCLLLAAQVAMFWRERSLARRVQFWCVVALAIAFIFSSAYSVQRVFSRYRTDDGALARFGHDVRNTAVAQHWRYEVVGGKEEGLLLYLRRPHFTKAEEAITRWNASELDALVIPAEESYRLLPALHGAMPAGVEASIRVNGELRRYLLLKRS